MKTRELFLSLALVGLLTGACAQTAVLGKDTDAQRFTAAVCFAPAPAALSQNQVVTRFRNVTQVRTITRMKRQYIYISPRRASLDISSSKIQLQHDPLIYNDQAYAPLRELMAALETFGLRATVDYSLVGGKHHVELSVEPITGQWPKSSSSQFSRGLYEMWKGRVAEAIAAFRQADKAGGEDAKDACGMADWLSEGNPKGIVVFHWWDMPKDVRVLVDDEIVDASVPMMVLSEGLHHFQILALDNYALFDGSVRVRTDKAITIAFGARPRS